MIPSMNFTFHFFAIHIESEISFKMLSNKTTALFELHPFMQSFLGLNEYHL